VDPLADFERTSFTFEAKTREVLRLGDGPAVIVMAEIPGITPRVADFARRVVGIGCTAVLPVLFGTPGKDPGIGYALTSIGPSCVSKQFRAFATQSTAPVTKWLRALAKSEMDRCGGPGVGAVGMCFTGGFALAMMLDDIMIAPVLSQPSLPIALPGRPTAKSDLHLSDEDLARVKQRVHDEDICVLGLRFTGDKLAPGERFQRLRDELGSNFIGVEIDSSPGNPYGHRKMAHSVLTEDLIDEPGQPTRQALEQVLAFLGERLIGTDT